MFYFVVLFLTCPRLILGDVNQPKERSYDHTFTELMEYYKQPIIQASVVSRPIEGLYWPIHTGVRVEVEDNSKWLIHHGNDYGTAMDTVVVDAKHMGKTWKVREEIPINTGNNFTIGDIMLYMQANPVYDVWSNNCNQVAAKIKRFLSGNECEAFSVNS
jgi:hypothetical protein